MTISKLARLNTRHMFNIYDIHERGLSPAYFLSL